MEYLSRFDFDIRYVKGINNKVADALSRYYKSDTSEDVHELNEYVNADIRVDKDQDNLPLGCLDELELDQLMTIRRSERLMNKEKLVKEGTEARDREAAELEAHAENQESSVPHPIEDKEEDITVFQSRLRGEDPMQNLTLSKTLNVSTQQIRCFQRC